jgi:hypothetical protein
MLLKPKAISTVGLVQLVLAASFVVWLLFFPSTGDKFAWPVVPRLTAMFIGASFIPRAYLGYHLWREKHWYRLRWQMWGNYAFLAVILLATYWHVDQMNWTSNIWVAHVWVIAYVLEPLTLPLIEPRGERSKEPLPPELRQGPILPGLRRISAGAMIIGIAIAGLLFVNPEFMDTRWPWPLDPFDARVMAAFLALAGTWAVWIYFAKDWAEAKLGVVGLILYTVALFGVWLVGLPEYDTSRENIWSIGVVAGVSAVLFGYYYWRQERMMPGTESDASEAGGRDAPPAAGAE